MTAEPTWPGDGPKRNHPGSPKFVGTWTVQSGLSPSAETDTSTSMAGIRSATGAERATTGLTTAGGRAGAVLPALDGVRVVSPPLDGVRAVSLAASGVRALSPVDGVTLPDAVVRVEPA